MSAREARSGRIPPPIERVPHWTGLYVGANLGYARNRGGSDIVDITTGTSLVGLSENMSGPIGGGQIGVNWQTGNGVLGLEAVGTMAHSYVEAFPTEEAAFRAYAEDYPDRTQVHSYFLRPRGKDA